ncbi:hypothetical protein [Flavobacterium sp.]|uniref:hypothetical protein n=1 Tax=Flavobacterium sp. TaxID=239 RepID=UPI003751744D
MKKLYSFFILFFIFNLGFCQEATLRILGNSKYSEIANYRVLLLDFEYNSEICNPLTQNKTIEIQVNEFNENLNLKKIAFQLLHKESLIVNPEMSKYYELLVPLDADDYEIKKIINSSGVKLVKTYYKFSEPSFLNEDKKAILALKNSQNKAIEIAKILNYEILEIVSIDDDTSRAKNIFEFLGTDNLNEERIESIYSLLEKLNEAKINMDLTKVGVYNLWVTYKIKPL